MAGRISYYATLDRFGHRFAVSTDRAISDALAAGQIVKRGASFTIGTRHYWPVSP